MSLRSVGRIGIALVALLTLSGCTLFDADDQETANTTTPPVVDESPAPEQTSPPTTAAAIPEPLPGDLFELLGPDDRIVVQSADNNLALFTFGGVVPAPTDSDATQPVFSADGSVLAWSRINAQTQRGELVFADVAADGSLEDLTEVPTPVISFYSAFAPGSNDRVAVLGNSRRGVGVAVVDRNEGATDVLDAGVPYYFVWNPDGDGFLGHVNTNLRSFDIATTTGENGVPVLPSFRAPGLLGDGSAVYVSVENTVGGAGSSSIDRIEADSGDGNDGFDAATARSVARFDGLGSLSLSPDSEHLAVVVEGALENSRVANVAIRQSGAALDRGLYVIDTQTDRITTLISTPVRAAFWAPNGQWLAALGPDSIGDGNSWVRWTVVDLEGNVLSRSPRLLMSQAYASTYLPFYDQYERSSTPWSPDSTRLVFPGESMAGDSGIWLHKMPMAGEDAQTFLIGDGVMALWSP